MDKNYLYSIFYCLVYIFQIIIESFLNILLSVKLPVFAKRNLSKKFKKGPLCPFQKG